MANIGQGKSQFFPDYFTVMNRSVSLKVHGNRKACNVFDLPRKARFHLGFPSGRSDATHHGARSDGLGDSNSKFQGEFLLRDKLRCDEVDVDDGHVALDIAKVFRYSTAMLMLMHRVLGEDRKSNFILYLYL